MVGNSMGGRVAIEVGLTRARARAAPRPAVPRGRVRSSAAITRSCACCGPSSGSCPTASAAAPSRASSGPVRRPRPDRPGRRRRRRRRVPAHLRLGRRAARLPGRGAQHLPRRARSAAAASTRAWPSCEPPGAVRVVLARPADPARLPRATSQRWLPGRRADRARRLRPRAPGRAPGADQRAAAALLRARRRAAARRRRAAAGRAAVRGRD